MLAQGERSTGIVDQLLLGIEQTDRHRPGSGLAAAAVNMHGLRPGTDHKIFDHIHTLRLD